MPPCARMGKAMRRRLAVMTIVGIAGLLPVRAQETWTEYRAAEQGFVISFPGAPKLATTALAGKTPLTHHVYKSMAAQRAYEVSVLEFAGGVNGQKWDTACFGRLIAAYAKGSGSSLLSQNPVTIGGRSGLEAVTEDPKHDRYHLIDVLAAGTRVYLLISVGPKGHEASIDAKRFRDSFSLIAP